MRGEWLRCGSFEGVLEATRALGAKSHQGNFALAQPSGLWHEKGDESERGRGEIGRRSRLQLECLRGNPWSRTAQSRGKLRDRPKPIPSQALLREGVETRRAAPTAIELGRRDSPDHERLSWAAAKAEVVRKSALRKEMRVRVPPSAPSHFTSLSTRHRAQRTSFGGAVLVFADIGAPVPSPRPQTGRPFRRRGSRDGTGRRHASAPPLSSPK